ncbi:MAG: hypothetical protein ACSHW1_19590 [Yoonia sp.]|uniref:hypothetical protein n=1 Tax=Yoonia sp. TaxID=2212373 RepID=UPI003EF13B6A
MANYLLGANRIRKGAIVMTLTVKQMGQDPAFDRFLSAIVGEDENGIGVSVLSMLARLEVDPWAEASDLTAMPDRRARKRLDNLMTRFHDLPSLEHHQGKNISAILALLPKRNAAANLNSREVADSLPTLATRAPFYIYFIAILFLGWVINLIFAQ